MSKKIAVFSAEGLALEALLEAWQESELAAYSPVLFHEDLIDEAVLFNQRPIAFQSCQQHSASDFALVLAMDVCEEQGAWFEQVDCPIVASVAAKAMLGLPQAQVVLSAELLALQLLLADTACAVKGVALLPASIHGKQGVDALASQTVSLLSGKSVKSGRLKQQLSFNAFTVQQSNYHASLREQMLAVSFSQAVELTAVQVSVFHGMGMQLWLDCESEEVAAGLIQRWQKMPEIELLKPELSGSIQTALQSERLLQLAQVHRGETGKQQISLWLAFDDIQIFVKQGLISAAQFLLKHD